jgi:hypothetical protein
MSRVRPVNHRAAHTLSLKDSTDASPTACFLADYDFRKECIVHVKRRGDDEPTRPQSHDNQGLWP